MQSNREDIETSATFGDPRPISRLRGGGSARSLMPPGSPCYWPRSASVEAMSYKETSAAGDLFPVHALRLFTRRTKPHVKLLVCDAGV